MPDKAPPAASQRTNPLIERLQAQARKHEVLAEGVRVCWREFGAGPPLALLHGGHGSWLHWARNIEALSGRFRLLVPDLPGYGDSDEPGPGGMQALIEATVLTLRALVGSDTPLDIAGFSFGGLVAAHIAARHRQVRRLILIGPAGHGGARRPRGKLLNWKQAAQQGDAAGLAAAMRHNLHVHMLHDAASIDDLAIQIHAQSCMKTRFVSKHVSRAGGLAELLEKFGGETLLAWGEHDVTADPSELARTIFLGRPQRSVRIIASCGHWAQFERAQFFNDLPLAGA